MKFVQLLVGLTIVFAGDSRDHQQLSSAPPFKGTWTLDKYESFDMTTKKWFDTPKRKGYTGYIMYDGEGHMAVQLIPPDFKDFDNSVDVDSLSDPELRRILKLQFASFSYFANCKISKTEDIIEHFKISSNNPREWKTTVTRYFEFKGDTLILTAAESIGGLRTRLRWVKLQ